jgi:hypothetical protein
MHDIDNVTPRTLRLFDFTRQIETRARNILPSIQQTLDEKFKQFHLLIF